MQYFIFFILPHPFEQAKVSVHFQVLPSQDLPAVCNWSANLGCIICFTTEPNKYGIHIMKYSHGWYNDVYNNEVYKFTTCLYNLVEICLSKFAQIVWFYGRIRWFMQIRWMAEGWSQAIRLDDLPGGRCLHGRWMHEGKGMQSAKCEVISDSGIHSWS